METEAMQRTADACSSSKGKQLSVGDTTNNHDGGLYSPRVVSMTPSSLFSSSPIRAELLSRHDRIRQHTAGVDCLPLHYHGGHDARHKAFFARARHQLALNVLRRERRIAQRAAARFLRRLRNRRLSRADILLAALMLMVTLWTLVSWIRQPAGDSVRGHLRGQAYDESYAPDLASFSNELELLSTSPRIYRYKGFLTSAECDKLKDLARDKLEISTVIGDDGSQGSSYLRTSTSTFLDDREDDFIPELNKRIGKLTRMQHKFEEIEVKRYESGQYYLLHQDFFGPESAMQNRNPRVATAVITLEKAEEGGDLVFPSVVNATLGSKTYVDVSDRNTRRRFLDTLRDKYEATGNMELSDMLTTMPRWLLTIENAAFRVQGEKGDAVLFYYYPKDPARRCPRPGANSCLIAGTYFCWPKIFQRTYEGNGWGGRCELGDSKSWHASSPTLVGTKWSATYWFREERVNEQEFAHRFSVDADD